MVFEGSWKSENLLLVVRSGNDDNDKLGDVAMSLFKTLTFGEF
jgi:hypothetical protein